MLPAMKRAMHTAVAWLFLASAAHAQPGPGPDQPFGGDDTGVCRRRAGS